MTRHQVGAPRISPLGMHLRIPEVLRNAPPDAGPDKGLGWVLGALLGAGLDVGLDVGLDA